MESVAAIDVTKRDEQALKSVVSLTPYPVSTGGWTPRSVWEKAFVFLASALFLIISIGTIRTESVTANEVLFIPAGVSYLQRHDGRMDIEEPPLVKVVEAIPVLFFHPKIDYSDSTWNANPGGSEPEYLFGPKFFELWNRNHKAMLFAARLPMIALTLLLGLSLYSMARQLAGPWGAAVTLSLFVTSPFFVAYGSIVHMDVPIALFSIWTMWCFASLWQKPTKRNAVLLAGSLAGALVTKFSAVFLFPAMFLAWVWFRFVEWRSANRGAAAAGAFREFRRERLAVVAIILSGVVVYLFYMGVFYRSDPRTILQNEFSSSVSGAGKVPLDILVRRMENHPALEPILLPPALYAGGLAYVVGHGSRPVYFLGHWYPRGVWFYFPVISFLKLAPGMLLLFILLATFAIMNFLGYGAKASIVPDSRRFHVRAIVAALIVFAAIAMASSLNVGVRHFSVPIGFAVLLCSLAIPLAYAVLGTRARFAFGAIAALVFSSLVTVLLTYPNYLSYYNVFRFNTPKQEIAGNSNLSWGQSMEELAVFFREHGVSAPYVDTEMSLIDPTVYIPGAHVWQCVKPDPASPEWVAISAYRLSHHPPNCLQLLRYPSWSVGDGTLVVFHITDSKALPESRP